MGVLLTFDYELFLGTKSGTIDNCLIKPTNMLLDILAKHKQQAIFFVDTTYLARMEGIQDTYSQIKRDYRHIRSQLKQIVQQGHILCHHLHPHWLDAQYNESENQWNLSNTRYYKIEDVDDTTKDRLFADSVRILNSILTDAGVKQSIDGFRAGGLCLDALESLLPFLKKYGITKDYSSVKPISEQMELYSSQDIQEYPITAITISGLWKIANALCYRMNKHKAHFRPMGDGISSAPMNKKHTEKQSYISFTLPISVELLNPVLLRFYILLYKKYQYIHFLSHPKLQSQATIRLLDIFLQRIAKN